MPRLHERISPQARCKLLWVAVARQRARLGPHAACADMPPLPRRPARQVLDPTGAPHATNTRAKLEAIIDDRVKKEAPLFGFEQASAACEGARRARWVQATDYLCRSGMAWRRNPHLAKA